MERRINRLSWLIGGAQGSGVDSAANMFAKACALGGLHVYGQREYYSNIMGEHSYYQLRIADRPVAAASAQADLLVSFDAETVFLHALDVAPQGGIIYDPKLAEVSPSRLPTIEERAREDLRAYLAERGLGERLDDLLQVVSRNGVQLFPIPYEELIKALAEDTGQTISKLKKATNTLAVASSCALLGYGIEWLEKAVSDIFKGKDKVIELNLRAAELAYEHVASSFKDGFSLGLEPITTDERRLFLTGNQAVALGKLLAGCSVQTYYPISPATDESVYLESHQIFPLNAADGGPQQGAVLVVQAEDEISAVSMAAGAALTGARASTSTSGPGFSLMVEGLGFAGMNEVPLVITLYQRGSPSTGLPTRSEQGDLNFAINAGHGEFPRIVLASGDIEEAFYDAIHAFNWAEKYQMPVIHLLDKSLASASQTLKLFDLEGVRLERGRLLGEGELEGLSSDGTFKSFAFSDTGISPRVVLGMRGGISWRTSDEHDEWGHISEDPITRVRMMDKRMKKLETAASEIPKGLKLKVFGDPEAEAALLSWGSPKQAILEAMERLRDEGLKLKFIQVRLLWPFPARELEQNLRSARKIIAIENNFSGQLAGLLRQQTGMAADHLIVKYNGRPMSLDEVYEAVRGILTSREAPRKVVLTHGA